jgi:HEAT repeat protein
VLARVQNNSILELRPLAVDCDMDAGGMPLIWFDGVNPDASVAWLRTLVTPPSDARRRVSESALVAISQHAGSAASAALVQFAQSGTAEIRGRALFWLAQRAADQALPAIEAALKDPDTEVKKQAVVALSRFPNGEGIPKLMEVARANANPEVRRHAMLMLGQSKDPRVVDFFAQILLR